MATIPARLRTRRAAAASFTGVNPVLLLGEMAVETDTGLMKAGDGVTAWNGLPYSTVGPTATQTLTNKTIIAPAGIVADDIGAASGISVQSEIDRRGIVYASRADAIAATVPAPVQVITVMHFGRALRYVAGTSTALATNGGARQWAPADLWTFLHWGADPTGASDSQAAVLAAITAATIQVEIPATADSDALMTRRALSGLSGTFALHSTVTLTRRAGVTIMDATFVHGGAAFPTGSATESAFFNVTGNSSGRSRNIYFERCNFMCAQGAEGVRWDTVRRCGMSDCLFYGFRAYSLRTDGGSTDCVFSRILSFQWWFSEVNGQAFTMRTAKCFDMNTADYILSNSIGAFGEFPFYHGAGGPSQVIGCHFYNGANPDPNPTNAYSAFVARNGRNVAFSGCYFDNASVGVEDGHARFIGCHFQQTAAQSGGAKLRLIAATAGTTFAGFVLTGCTFNGGTTDDTAIDETEQTAAVAANRRYVIGFNNRTNATAFTGPLPEYWLRTGVPTIT